MTWKNRIPRLPAWGMWLAPALLAFAPLFLRLWRFATCGAGCGADSLLGLFSDALTGGVFLVLMLACPRALRWLPALLWALFQVGSLELYHAMQRYPVWQDLHYLFDANFVRNSTGGFKFAAPVFTVVTCTAALAASLLHLPKMRLRRLAWVVPALAVLFFVHARLEVVSSHAVTANRNPLHNFVLDAAHRSRASTTVALPESLKHVDLSGASLLGDAAGKAKNVLIVVMEGIPGLYIPEIRKNIGVDEYEVTMDKLDKSTHGAMLIPDFVAHSHQTIRGLYAILCGDFSKLSYDTPKPFELLGKPERAAACLPAQLREHGFSTHYLQGARLDFMAKDRVMTHAGFQEVHGSEWFASEGIENPFPFWWGAVDAAFFQGAQRYIAELRKKEHPWMLTLLTVGTHHPFGVPKDIAARYASPRDVAVAFLDEAVADFLDKLKADGTLDDTLVIVMSDESHGSPRLDWASSWGLGIVIAPEQEKLPRIKPGGYGLVDVEASILDYLHLPVPAQILGRSFFRNYDTPREMFSFTGGVLRRHTGATSIRCAGARTCKSVPAASILGQPPQEVKELPEQQAAETYALASALTDALRAGGDVQRFSFAMGEQRKTPGMLIGGQYMTLPANADVTVRVQMTMLEGSGESVAFRIEAKRDHDSRLNELVDNVSPMPELPSLPALRPGESMDETFSFHNAIIRRAVSFAMVAEGAKGLVRFDRFDVSIKKNPGSGTAPEQKELVPELSLLERAVQAGNAQQVRTLLDQGVDVDAVNTKGSTALMWAVQYEHASIAKMLLEKGANPNAENKAGYIALGKAAAKGYTAIVNLLLGYGANINQADENGRTALMNAAAQGHADIVQMFIDKGVNVSQANKDGGTSLMEAAARGHVDTVRILLEHGADVNQADKDGWTALMQAVAQGRADIVQLLVEKGANVNAVNKDGATPLMEAVRHGHLDATKLLLNRGADVYTANKSGVTALWLAAAFGNSEAAALLLDKGADVNVVDENGATPLMEAVWRGYSEVAKLLLAKGADVNVRHKNGSTALWMAEQNKYTEIVEVLKAAGAKK